MSNSKALLSTDYDAIIKRALCLPESDLQGYYFGIAEEHYRTTPEVAEELNKAVNRWEVWFVGKVHEMGHLGWEVDENGKQTLIGVDAVGIPMIYDFGVYGHLRKADIEKQRTFIKHVGEMIGLVRKVDEHERKLPIAARERLMQFDRPKLSDFDGWRDRLNLISGISTEYHEKERRQLTDRANEEKKRLDEALIEQEKANEATLKKSQPEAKTFEELFSNPDKVKPCIDVLNQLGKGVIINDNGEYVGSSQKKSIIGVWFEELMAKGWVSDPGSKTVARLANAYFPELEASEKVFRGNVETQTADNVRHELQALLANI